MVDPYLLLYMLSIALSILLSLVILLFVLAKIIRVYGPQTSKVITSGCDYQIKGKKKRLGKFKIHNKIYLMKTEVLDDFYDLIKYSDYILTKHKIQYTVAYGTLLGAIRHGGIMPWDDDADLNIHLPNERYDEVILSLKKEIEEDGFLLLKNYDAEYFHLCKAGGKNKFPYIDWYQYHQTYTDDILYPIKRAPFEDFEVCVPVDPLACVDIVFNSSGKDDPLNNVIHNYPFSRYYSLWIVQFLKRVPLIHWIFDRISNVFVKIS